MIVKHFQVSVVKENQTVRKKEIFAVNSFNVEYVIKPDYCYYKFNLNVNKSFTSNIT